MPFPRFVFRSVLAGVALTLVVCITLFLLGVQWAAFLVPVLWVGVMGWVHRFRCNGCGERHLVEVSRFAAHPRWLQRRCPVCGMAND